MRYNEQVNGQKAQKEKKQRELPKAGGYSVKDVEKSKDVPWRK